MRPFRLGTFGFGGGDTFVAFAADTRVVPVSLGLKLFHDAQPRAAMSSAEGGLLGLLHDWEANFPRLCEVHEYLADRQLLDDPEIAASRERLTVFAPILRPSKMLYAAANYGAHVAGMRASGFTGGAYDKSRDGHAGTAKLRPYLFLKAPSALAGANDDIALPAGWANIDWEVELAVAIGKAAKNVGADRARDFIAGYMTTNDVSCRSATWREDRPTIRSDWFAGKSHDGFAPMGPYFVPRAFVADHSNLRLWLKVNGALMQDGNTREMTFGVDEQIAYASSLIALEPGDVLATGTPAGTGQERGRFLASGDLVECEVEGLGQMRNRFV